MKVLCVLLAFLPSSGALIAGSGLPFWKGLAKDRELPPPWGISLDFFAMDQPYIIDQLSFDAPGIVLASTDAIKVDNEITYFDVNVDAWLLPFLNVFAVLGTLDGETLVDLSGLGLPIPLTTITVNYDGLVYGGGATLAAGGKTWFVSLTSTFTKTNLSGDFSSKVKSFTLQPRVGYHSPRFEAFAGAMRLDAEESHQGAIEIPFLGFIDFEVVLAEKEAWNANAGLKYNVSRHWSLLGEGGFGDRKTWLATLNYRF